MVDFSSVYSIDTMVANQIFKVINSLKLLAIETTLTKLCPEVEQTIGIIVIYFSILTIKPSLQKVIDDIPIPVENNK
ncbi:rsbT co-antagonist protein RsbR [Priestia aryabhattai B8W22]|uniref:STAS domain-containing protein n=1 Tax=Priestia aryabhattai TaxID=412384 RepID=UPI00087F5ED4|nr:rsbT co-antagonist protein RsbR [Priestia aryabhattai B8W22]